MEPPIHCLQTVISMAINLLLIIVPRILSKLVFPCSTTTSKDTWTICLGVINAASVFVYGDSHLEPGLNVRRVHEVELLIFRVVFGEILKQGFTGVL
jgi:hypothetical protein